MRHDKNQSAIWAAHGGDLEAIRKELRESTIDELVERYQVARSVVGGWEKRHKTHSQRKCAWCKTYKPGDQMIRTALGGLGRRCVDCKIHPVFGESWTQAYERGEYHKAWAGTTKRSSTTHAVMVEAEMECETLLKAARMRLPYQVEWGNRWGVGV